MSRDRERTKAAEELADRHCADCARAKKPMPAEDVAALLWRLDGWSCVNHHHLRKDFRFKDFAQALAFVNQCGRIAEEEGHHPDLVLKWGLVRVEICTHRVDGLTESDFVLAAKIDRLRRG